MNELMSQRERHVSLGDDRICLVQMLTWILCCVAHECVIRMLQGTDADDEYMISDANLLVNKYVSVPRDMGHLNCGAYVAGIVKVRYHTECEKTSVTTFDSANAYAYAHVTHSVFSSQPVLISLIRETDYRLCMRVPWRMLTNCCYPFACFARIQTCTRSGRPRWRWILPFASNRTLCRARR